MEFCFIILHYLTAKDTIECIDSIRKIHRGKEAQIIIVDNHSNNGSIEKVEEFIGNDSNYTVLKNAENVGFARGNNVGYRFVKQNFGTPMVIILNNDTIIRQTDFLDKIEAAYAENHFAVLGPDIISLIDGGHQNPIGRIPNRSSVKKQILKYRILLTLSRLGLYSTLQKRFGRSDAEKKLQTSKPQSKVLSNQALHGSCLVFSPIFCKAMDEAFCADTFLYKEEFILAKRCEEKNLKMVFDSEIEIYHKEDSATNMIVSSTKEKREFLFANLVQSNTVLLKYM